MATERPILGARLAEASHPGASWGRRRDGALVRFGNLRKPSGLRGPRIVLVVSRPSFQDLPEPGVKI
jgi:hypothetical protein